MPTTTHPEAFAAAIDHAFSRAPVVRTVAAGGFRVALAFADEKTADGFVPAFPPAAEGPVDFSVAIVIEPDAVLDTLVPLRRNAHFTYVNRDCYAHWEPVPGETLQIYDGGRKLGLLWVPTGQALETVRSRPALPVLHAHAAPTAWSPVHAAGVGVDGRFLLLAGPGGSGKSTAAVACAAAGWDYAGDDFVMVEPLARRVEPIYASARLRPGAVDLLGDFARRIEVATTHDYGEQRHELRLGAGFADVPIRGGEIAGILLPRRTGEARFTTRPARPVETYSAMVGVTVNQLPGLRDRLIPKLLKLATAVPAFVVDTGSEPARIPDAMKTFLATLLR